ncbi:MAG: hypothetical protein EZS28_014156 [Streblomastix strix]|uniref:Secreted protein n=1 Tax=Streblomastix strix TaxID=222440 RepID=A0A5J4W6G3_9EUKA|nr:MAG: hypothetical protein EZS28_014156 [Streblomastix strix]
MTTTIITMIMIMTTTAIIDATESETTGTISQIQEEVGKKRVTSREGSGNGQNNEDQSDGRHREIERQQLRQFRVFRNRREQALSPVQTVTGAPVYI